MGCFQEIRALRGVARRGSKAARYRVVAGVVALLGILGPFAPAGEVSAQAEQSEEGPRQAECCALLLIPVGGRAAAMGGSLTAMGGPESIFLNPAGMVEVEGTSLAVHHTENVNVATQVESFSAIFTPFDLAVGVSYRLFDRGDHSLIDEAGQSAGELSIRDHMVVASVAVPLPAGISVGASVRHYQERVGCAGQCAGVESVARANAYDVGVLYRPSWAQAARMGVSLMSLSPGLELDGESEPFPTRLHVGGAYDVLSHIDMEWEDLALWLALDARAPLQEDQGGTEFMTGLELDVQRVIFLRTGYVAGSGLGSGAAVGLGVKLDRFRFDVSRSFVNSGLGPDVEPLQISLLLDL